MAEWASVEQYIKQKYVVSQQDGKWLFLDFDMGQERGQRVMITTTGNLIQFLSPFANLDEVSIEQVFAAMRAESILFGITGVNDMLLVTHSQLLDTADQEEVDFGIQLVTDSADRLERLLSRQDRY